MFAAGGDDGAAARPARVDGASSGSASGMKIDHELGVDVAQDQRAPGEVVFELLGQRREDLA